MTSEAKDILVNQKKHITLNLKLNYKPYTFIIVSIIQSILFTTYFAYHYSAWFAIITNGIIIGVSQYIIGKRDKNILGHYKKRINKDYSSHRIHVSLSSSPKENIITIYTILGFIFSYWFIYDATGWREWYQYIFIFFLSLLGVIAFLVTITDLDLRTSNRLIKDYEVYYFSDQIKDNVKQEEVVYVTRFFPDILTAYNPTKETELILLDSIDYNDTQIAKLESQLKSNNTKIEAYLLESVLLGGLAFSGFLTVISSNLVKGENSVFYKFCSNLNNLYREQSIENILQNVHLMHHYLHRDDFFICIMFLCLASSVFFLLVLTLRMRYMSLALDMDHLIRTMVIFNAKEEELYNSQINSKEHIRISQSSRLSKITKKVNYAISDANKLLKELNPVIRFMSIYRNIAVGVFYLVLIVSGFYFSPIIALIIFLLAVLVYMYGLFDSIIKKGKINTLINRHK